MNRLRITTVLFLGLLFHAVAGAWDIEWDDEYGNGLFIFAADGKTDATGFYVGGGVAGAALPGQTGSGGSDAYLRKYSFAGTVLWTRQFGTVAPDAGLGVTTDATGVYLAGSTAGTFPGQASAGNRDAFMRKYDTDGQVVWTRQFGTSGFDELFRGATIHTTGVYVAGETDGTFPGEMGGNGVDFFVARLDAQTGQLIWARQFGIRSGFPLSIGGVSVDDTGIYAVGTTFLGVSPAAMFRKYDFNGNLLWSREFLPGPGVSCSGTLWGVAAHDGNVYVTGQWDERYFDYAFQDPASSCGKNGLALGTGTSVGVLLKYDSASNLLWRRRIKGAAEGSDSFTGAKTIWASESGIYVGANLTTTFPGHIADGPRSDRSECPGVERGNRFFDKLDAYVRRYDFDGNVIWTHQFGSNVFDLVNGIGTDTTGVYLTGDTSCDIGEDGTFSGGFRDAFVLRIAIEPTSLPGQVQLIIGQLETLSDAGRLGSGEFSSLVRTLEAALGALNRMDIKTARQDLEAFVQIVSNYQYRGTLTSAEAAGLTAAADGVIAQL
jgi:hypothetical protein